MTMARDALQGKVVIVTGASSGIGKALALQLAEKGAKLVIAARNRENLEAVAAECRAKGAEVRVSITDVSIAEQCAELVKVTVETFGGIDVLINNAGISMFALFEDVKDLGVFRRIMDVNYFGSVYCSHYALPHLKKSRGRLVGISSLTGKTGVPTRSGYAASKHAMAGFFDTLRIELAPDGVDVTMIYPGFVATEVRQRASTGDGSALEQSTVQETKVMTAETCAAIILKAVEKRKREVVMTPRAKIGLWLKLIAPGLVDGIARKAIDKGK